MSKHQDKRLPDELEALGQQVREQRRWAEDSELDEIKVRAMQRAQRPTSKGAPMRARLATAVLTLALVGGGGGAVLAASGGGGKHKSKAKGSAAEVQYCPPKSPGGQTGKPKSPPGNACGHPLR